MKKVSVRVVNNSDFDLPVYATAAAAGLDLRAYLEEPIVLAPMERTLIPTGLSIELPVGYEAQIRPRSGLAYRHGITVLNSPGTIDSDYRGEIKVLIINLGQANFTISSGERIAQMVVARHEQVVWENTTHLSETQRGAGGFGHTGR